MIVLMLSCPATYCNVNGSVYSPASVRNVYRSACRTASAWVLIFLRSCAICSSSTQGPSHRRLSDSKSYQDQQQGRPSTAFPIRRAAVCEEADIENGFQKKCRKGARFAPHTAFSAILSEISCLFSLALEFVT